MQDRVLDPADVLLDGQPEVDDLLVPRGVVVPRVGVAQEVPRGVDEGVHRVRLAPCRAAAARARDIDPLLCRRERRAPLGQVVVDRRAADRQLVVGHRHDAARVAVDDRDRAAPVALPREQPVAQAVADRRLAEPSLVEPRDDRRLPSGAAARELAELTSTSSRVCATYAPCLGSPPSAGDDLADSRP
jgi:hypothetical protein